MLFIDTKLQDIIKSTFSDADLIRFFELVNTAVDPLITIVVPVYNPSVNVIKQHVKSLYKQSTLLPYEILYVDNNSTDGSISYLESIGARIIKEKRQGVNWARQAGLNDARGQIVLSMDPDTVYWQSYIDDMCLPFFFNKDLVLTWSSARYYEDNFKVSSKLSARSTIKKFYMRGNSLLKKMNLVTKVRAVCLGFRTKAFTDIGYHEDLPQTNGCDDGILAITIYNQGEIEFVNTLLWTAYVRKKPVSQGMYPFNKIGYN